MSFGCSWLLGMEYKQEYAYEFIAHLPWACGLVQ